MRVAAIDCGTNSIRMLIAERGPHGVRDISRRVELVRLGQEVDAAKAFHPDALRRTFAAIDSFAAELAAAQVEVVRFVATSATRDVTNRQELFDGVRQRLGVIPEVISGLEEARLSYLGATQGRVGLAEPVLVCDVGGGSTELVLGRGGQVEQLASLDVGAVRLTERFLHHDPPHPGEVAQARAYVDDRLTGCGIDLAAAKSWVAVAGTVTTMVAISKGMAVYDPVAVNGAELSMAEVKRLTEFFLRSTIDQLVRIPTLPRMRAEVIAGGGVVVERVAWGIGAPVMVVSESDILDGLIASVFRPPNALGCPQ